MRAWKFGDDVDTDAIIPGRYLVLNTPEELAAHAFEGVRPEFASSVKKGDVVVAGRNFGCGSSREHAPLALKGCGIQCVIAKSFARIFFRNSINIGLPLLECEGAGAIEDGDELRIDMGAGIVENITQQRTYRASSLPDFIQRIVGAGGLIPFARELLEEEQ
ncbi:3-isopropylmalate dehydratase small subunit [Methermicoccus shengliensis]|uniref:3-isopropylmalate dehydratase small subunit n=1 Tax=Methermicoccus shengliensis TaxID=660064 RepID=A0A832VY18_9EURY|nr:3-isopropylmalate dehydratase small subunit [Methermicoccus shengliensis]KUK04108.1 MAG: 3-isopropylmalate dehydratase small subunit [Euryarchaeota archaeon 55_53]KUK29952.1 MAG: 3-isopropylmalate dehydratase small subunit [Methanosarcinales archeaon 56_1174]MDI3487994.1 3-isopropylmalate/(R)-2-methylmalate dehydratase small subunit [Methanosarcinales archaeon]MDN5295590.1 3-isopropylmalate/(R)-2-methylmalate dehydratase small subunit [Methanosarcinales archaeon]HIH70382.1 3-isopropylmalate